MPATRTNKPPRRANSTRLYRFSFGLWSAVGIVALLAPWPYTLGALLCATFMQFSALDERLDD